MIAMEEANANKMAFAFVNQGIMDNIANTKVKINNLFNSNNFHLIMNNMILILILIMIKIIK